MPDILIVDDSISVRKALEITLRNHNVSSASAVSAEHALEQLAQDPGAYDLLMIDVIMPGKSGVELCEDLKADPRYAALQLANLSLGGETDAQPVADVAKAHPGTLYLAAAGVGTLAIVDDDEPA